MSDFDIAATVRRIIGLYRERGMERTSDDIDKLAVAISRRSNLSHMKALEAIEDDLLSRNPNPEKWE